MVLLFSVGGFQFSKLAAVIFEWDERQASANARKHSVTFEQAATVFTTLRL
jgi:hypothetical protein